MRVTSGLSKNIAEWSQFMRQIEKETKNEIKHRVDFLPLTDMDPNNLSTIYTMLMFVIDECNTH